MHLIEIHRVPASCLGSCICMALYLYSWWARYRNFFPGESPSVQCATASGAWRGSLGFAVGFRVGAWRRLLREVTGVPGFGVGLRFANPTYAATASVPVLFPGTVDLICLSEALIRSCLLHGLPPLHHEAQPGLAWSRVTIPWTGANQYSNELPEDLKFSRTRRRLAAAESGFVFP